MGIFESEEERRKARSTIGAPKVDMNRNQQLLGKVYGDGPVPNYQPVNSALRKPEPVGDSRPTAFFRDRNPPPNIYKKKTSTRKPKDDNESFKNKIIDHLFAIPQNRMDEKRRNRQDNRESTIDDEPRPRPEDSYPPPQGSLSAGDQSRFDDQVVANEKFMEGFPEAWAGQGKVREDFKGLPEIPRGIKSGQEEVVRGPQPLGSDMMLPRTSEDMMLPRTSEDMMLPRTSEDVPRNEIFPQEAPAPVQESLVEKTPLPEPMEELPVSDSQYLRYSRLVDSEGKYHGIRETMNGSSDRAPAPKRSFVNPKRFVARTGYDKDGNPMYNDGTAAMNAANAAIAADNADSLGRYQAQNTQFSDAQTLKSNVKEENIKQRGATERNDATNKRYVKTAGMRQIQDNADSAFEAFADATEGMVPMDAEEFDHNASQLQQAKDPRYKEVISDKTDELNQMVLEGNKDGLSTVEKFFGTSSTHVRLIYDGLSQEARTRLQKLLMEK